MTRRFLGIVAIAVSTAACGLPFWPGGSEEGKVEWTVDGRTVEASDNGMGALRGGGSVFVTGIDCGGNEGIGITALDTMFVGTHPVGGNFNVSATYTEDSASWETNSRVGSGSLTVASLSQTRMAGSFDFVMVPAGSSGGGTRSVRGSFDVAFHDDTIC
jgi:hypothetical protein